MRIDAGALRSIERVLPRAVDAPAKSRVGGTASFFSIPCIRTEYADSRDTIPSCRRIGRARCRETCRSFCAMVQVNFDRGVRHAFERGWAHGSVAAVSADDNTGFALSVPLARAGSSRAELRM